MGRPEVALSAITVVVGTTIYWVATYQGAGFRLSTVGDNFMTAGAIGFAASTTNFAVSQGPTCSRTPAGPSTRRRSRKIEFGS